jgi:histidinol-phosphate phosphatase family protein
MGIHRKKIGPLRQVWSKKNTTLRPAIFLDRDGTLIRYRNVITKKEHVRPLASVSSLKRLADAGFLLIVITNQPPIEKGDISVGKAKELNETLRSNLKKLGVLIDAIYTCPHRHITGCDCKKPRLGMIESARKDFNIDIKKSWLVGDTHTDIETGKRARLKTILLATGSRTKDRHYFEITGDFRVQNLNKAVAKIVR